MGKQGRDLEAETDSLSPGYISGQRVKEFKLSRGDNSPDIESNFWSNLLWHGIGSPLQLMMIQCFFDSGGKLKNLALSRKMASKLRPGDLIFSLNYDTVFELALCQEDIKFVYSPNTPEVDQLLVCKPHGSLNMVSNNRSFKFGQPDWLGMPQPEGFLSYSGIIPPHLNESYAQHLIAVVILTPVRDRRPEHVILWGVGLTNSDNDLTLIYKMWMESAETIDIINPSKDVVNQVHQLTANPVRHFFSMDEWLASN
jgi:hypothetical protein